uniref:Uncharacterized protein n=1 Tax=Anopheles christyi TaxID=43041 RepID=A0A182JNY6_9DIPT
MYQKAPRADIMIPMGSKAFVPGQLYHTGEVMVSHGCGYFSECSVEQAQSIADRRILLADELLQKYERERTLYSDKLEMPLASEAFAGGEGGRDIIEEYDEETETRWREEHRCRVRESKQKEAKERAALKDAPGEVSDKELFAKLEEMELLEELENEMDQLDLPTGDDDDDQLGQLMRGEIRLNDRKRTAHKQTEVSTDRESVVDCQPGNYAPRDEKQQKNDVEEELPEEEIETTDDEEGEERDEEEDDDISAEFSQLLLETKNYSHKEKIKFFKAKLKDVRQRLYHNSIDLVQKVDLYQLHDELEEALDFLLPSNESETKSCPKPTGKKSTKEEGRKIKFADEDQIKLIGNRHQDELETLNNNSKNTLFLPIVHSPVHYNSDTTDEIVSPADIYRSFLQQSLKQTSTVELKSILKNPKTTNHHYIQSAHPSVVQQPASRTSNKPTEPASDVIGDVVEHTVVDVQPVQQQEQQSKKKVSRFKQQRK